MTVAAWATALLCLGSALAMAVRSHAELSAATDIGSMILTCLGGALVPLASMPSWARPLAPASPGYWAVRGLDAALDDDGRTALTSAGILIGAAALAAAVAGLRLARGWGRGRLR